MRVVIMKDFIKESFPQTPLLDYALQVEKVTTAKVIMCAFLRPFMPSWLMVNLFTPCIILLHNSYCYRLICAKHSALLQF